MRAELAALSCVQVGLCAGGGGGNINVGLVWGCEILICLTLMNACVNVWVRKRKLHKFLKLLDI